MAIGNLATEGDLENWLRGRLDGYGVLSAVQTLKSIVGEGAVKPHVATPTTSNPTTVSTTMVALAEMAVTADFRGNPVVAMFTGHFNNNSAGGYAECQLFDAGVAIVDSLRSGMSETVNGAIPLSMIWAFTPAAGSRTLDVRWLVNAGTGTAVLKRRQFVVLELVRVPSG